MCVSTEKTDKRNLPECPPTLIRETAARAACAAACCSVWWRDPEEQRKFLFWSAQEGEAGAPGWAVLYLGGKPASSHGYITQS